MRGSPGPCQGTEEVRWDEGTVRVRAKRDIHGDWTDDFVPKGTLGWLIEASDPQDHYPDWLDCTVSFDNGVLFHVSSREDFEEA